MPRAATEHMIGLGRLFKGEFLNLAGDGVSPHAQKLGSLHPTASGMRQSRSKNHPLKGAGPVGHSPI